MKEWKQKTWFKAADGTRGSNALVAKEAGVASGTVNNVFNHPERVMPETKEKVLKAVKKLNYTPNELPTMKRCTLCKVVKSPEDFYHGYKSLGQRYSTNYKYPESRCKECQHLKNREYSKKNKTKISKQTIIHRRQKQHGVSEEDYNAMVLLQNNLCAICNKPSHRTLHLDHDHKTGKVRGLLCYACNTGIGLLKDDINYLANAIKYLTSPYK